MGKNLLKVYSLSRELILNSVHNFDLSSIYLKLETALKSKVT